MVLVCLAGPHGSFALSLRREFSLGLFKNTEAVKTLGTFRGGINARYIVRQTCIFGGQRYNSVLPLQHSPNSSKGKGLVTRLWSHGVVKVLERAWGH